MIQKALDVCIEALQIFFGLRLKENNVQNMNYFNNYHRTFMFFIFRRCILIISLTQI